MSISRAKDKKPLPISRSKAIEDKHLICVTDPVEGGSCSSQRDTYVYAIVPSANILGLNLRLAIFFIIFRRSCTMVQILSIPGR